MNQLATASDPICNPCKKIDFSKISGFTDDPNGAKSTLLDADASRFIPPIETSCTICRVLSTCVRQKSTAIGGFELWAVSLLQHCRWADERFKGAQESAMLVVTPKPFCEENIARGNDEGYVVVYPNGTRPGLFRPRIVPESFDIERTRQWLQVCKDCHGKECHGSSQIVTPKNLIDCSTLKVIPTTGSMQWVALSYVWGKQKASVSKDHPSLPSLQLPSPTPPLISDAITVVKSLGYRYLWVDKYCIDQRNEAEKACDINNMDLIYGRAELTIVAASGASEEHGLHGMNQAKRSKQQVVELSDFTILSTGPDPLASIQQSKWWTRGWTFQEGFLSPRTLVFTEYQAYFECHEVSWNESFGGLEFIEKPDQVDFARNWKASSFLMNPYSARTVSAKYWDGGWLKDTGSLGVEGQETHTMLQHRHYELFKLAEKYCSRNLTFDSDSLNAFSEVLRFLERNSVPPTLNLYGLPFVALGSADDKTVEMYWAASLCWYHQASSSIRRRSEFPSWTWAGWAGPIRSIRLDQAKRWVSRTRDVLFEDERGRMYPAAQYLRSNEYRHSAHAMSLTALEIPPKFFSVPEGNNSWTDCKVVGQHLVTEGVQLPAVLPSVFLQRLETRAWSCVLLGDYWLDKSPMEEVWRFLMIVEWDDYKSAARIGMLIARCSEISEREVDVCFDEATLSYIQVRIV